MTRKSVFVLGLIAATAIGSGAYADANHGRDGRDGANDRQGYMHSQNRAGGDQRPGMMGGHADMMQMMKQMHAAMMGGQGSPMMGMMGGQGPMDMMGGQGMMGMMGGQGPMGMMGGQGPMGGMGQMGKMVEMFDADGDGSLSPEELRQGLQSQLAEFDTDGDGSLSIAEFENLNSAMIRETMVDRFQALDNDGDGQVTEAEMTALADRMDRMQQMRAQISGADGNSPAMQPGQNMPMGNSGGNGNGNMMNNN